MDMKISMKVKYFLLVTLLGVLIVGCVGRSPAAPSPTALADEPTADVSPTVEVDEGESGVETAIAVPTETALTPTVEPTKETTCTCAPAPKASETVEATPVVITGGEKAEMIEKVKADLASRLGISEDEISVVSAEAKNWSDASLGCPEEGMMYAQVLTPGYQIILLANGVEYDYRTDQGYFKICKQ
ncbi:MAG: hypothetical protein KGY46_11775 [Anaerolineales bacterium]|nr:hypothetical protein [Anaerolineales bacterium]